MYLVKKVVLVTGANGGIGAAIARKFLEEEESAQVWLGVRRGRAVAEELAKEFDGRCQLVDLDISDPASWEAAVEKISSEGEPVNVLVNNGGTHRDHLLATMSDEDWSSVVRAHLDGSFYGCRAVVKGMMFGRWGRIVNMASLSAFHSPAGQANYAAAKAGMIAMGKALAREVGRAGITVNAVCPGYIETAALEEMSDEARKAAKKEIPVRRFGTPEEVADAVFFLAGEQSSYITGSYLRIDGGIG